MVRYYSWLSQQGASNSLLQLDGRFGQTFKALANSTAHVPVTEDRLSDRPIVC